MLLRFTWQLVMILTDSSPASKYTRNADGHFVCPYCSDVKKKQNTMHYHIKRVHDKILPFQCKQCEDQPKFLQKSSYLHHLATSHPENPHPSEQEKNMYAEIVYNCTACSQSSHTKANVIIHYARTHSDWIPPFVKDEPCSSCNKVFQSSSAYLYHSVSCFKGPDQLNMVSRAK